MPYNNRIESKEDEIVQESKVKTVNRHSLGIFLRHFQIYTLALDI